MEYVFVLGAGQGVLLTLFLLNKKENRTANRILAFTMFAFTIDLLMAAYNAGEHYYKYPQFIALTVSFPYLYGPCIFLFVYLLGHKKKGFRAKYLLHFIPFLIVNLIGVFSFFFSQNSYKLAIMTEAIPMPWDIKAISLMIPVHGGIYAIITILEAFKFNKRLKNSYSNIDKINLGWVNFYVIGSVIVWAVVFIAYLINFIFSERFPAFVLIYISISILIYSIGYKSLNRPEMGIEEDAVKPEHDAEQAKAESYKKSGLNEETAQQYLAKLLSLMDEQRPYLNNNLNLPDLSKMLDISTHNLSELINTKLSQNFYDFINKYRVEEVKRLIETDKNNVYNILALGFEAGFSSKSAFYSSFKKVTGITPAQFRDIH